MYMLTFGAHEPIFIGGIHNKDKHWEKAKRHERLPNLHDIISQAHCQPHVGPQRKNRL